MTDLNPAVLRAFWHKSRKMFLPWTAPEIARRLKADPDAVTLALWSLARVGSAATRRPAGNGEPSTWHLTPAGQAEARALFTAEAFAKGGNA